MAFAPSTIVFPGGGVDSRDGVAPVSYTHLRAHETVLDLVCRLLLEKKTHNHELVVEAK